VLVQLYLLRSTCALPLLTEAMLLPSMHSHAQMQAEAMHSCSHPICCYCCAGCRRPHGRVHSGVQELNSVAAQLYVAPSYQQFLLNLAKTGRCSANRVYGVRHSRPFASVLDECMAPEAPLWCLGACLRIHVAAFLFLTCTASACRAVC
jgi:hypothetical protein